MEEQSDLPNNDFGLVHQEAVSVKSCSENDTAIDEVLEAAEKHDDDDEDDDESDHMKAESVEDDEDSEPPPERRSRRAPKPSERGLEYIAQRPSLLPQSSVNNEATIMNSLNKSERTVARKSTGSNSNSENNQRAKKSADGNENSDINIQDVVLINVGVSAGREAVVLSRRSAGRFHLRVINSNGGRVGETIMRRPSFTFVRSGGSTLKSSSFKTGRASSNGTVCEKSEEDLLNTTTSSSCGGLDAEMTEAVDIPIDILMDVPKNIPTNSSNITEQSVSESVSESESESESESPDVQPVLSPVQNEAIAAATEDISSMTTEAKNSGNDSNIIATEESESFEVLPSTHPPDLPPPAVLSSTTESSILQSASLYAPSSPSDASIFSIDSPGSSSPYHGEDQMDVDDVVEDLFDNIDRGTDGRAEGQGWKGSRFSGGASKKNNKNRVKSEGRDTTGEDDEGEEEEDDDDDRPAAGAHMFKKYVRLSTGSYHGRIARVTSLSKTLSRYSVNVLSADGSKVPAKHTTVISDSVYEVVYADCSEGEKAMIERDRELVIEKEILLNKMIERSNLKKLEMEREKKERVESRAKGLLGDSDAEDQSEDASDAEGDREQERESSRPKHSITKDTIDTYIRIQSGMYVSLIGRIMSVTGGKCSVRVVSEGEYRGRKTSIVASNYDPDLIATEREKELIAADMSEVEQKQISINTLSQVSNHPLNFDFANKYIRLTAGLYNGAIGRISKYATTSPYSVRILDMPGLKLNRHTTCTPSSIELELNCNAEELLAVESDRAQMVKMQRKSIQPNPLPPSVLASLPAPGCPSAALPYPSHHLLASAATSSSSLNPTQPTTSTSVTATSTMPSSFASSSSSIPSSSFSSSSSSSHSDEKKANHVGNYVRLLGGMFRDAVGRVSSQTPKTHRVGWLFRITIIWEDHWKGLSIDQTEKLSAVLRNIQNIPDESTVELTTCSDLEKRAIDEDRKKRRRRLCTFIRTPISSSSAVPPSSDPSSAPSSSTPSSAPSSLPSSTDPPSSDPNPSSSDPPSSDPPSSDPNPSSSEPTSSDPSSSDPPSSDPSSSDPPSSDPPSSDPSSSDPSSSDPSSSDPSSSDPPSSDPPSSNFNPSSSDPSSSDPPSSESSSSILSSSAPPTSSSDLSSTVPLVCPVAVYRPWTILQGAQPAPPPKIPEGDNWVGAYVRLMTGLSTGKLGRVTSCTSNGTSCGVYILRTGDPQDKAGRHTNMSILHLEKIDMTYLDTRERAIIDDSESRRFKVNEEGARKRASSDSPYSLSVRKRPREGDESDEEEASTTELPKDGLESRNNLYWAVGLKQPVLWYSEFSETPGDLPIQVQPLHCEPGSDSKAVEMITEGTGGDDASTDSFPPLNATTVAEDLGSTIPSPEELTTGMEVEHGGKEGEEGTEGEVEGAAIDIAVSVEASSLPSAPSSSSSSSSSTPPSPPHTSSLTKCVLRSSLIALDDDILHMYCTHKATSQLSGALLDFAEWDDYRRQSYTWSDTVVELMRDSPTLSEWAAAALTHPIGICFKSHRKRYLFSLIAQHGGFDEDYEEYSSDDELPEEDSSEFFAVEYPNDITLKTSRKSSNKKNRKKSPIGIAQLLNQELDLNSVSKNRVRCSREMWVLVKLLATTSDNQADGFNRYVSRVGGQFQVGEIPVCARKRKKAPERELIFTRKRKASLPTETPLDNSKNITENVPTEQCIKVESPGPRIDMAPVVWTEDCRFQPSYILYAEWSRREKRDLERKRKRKEVHSSDTQKRRGQHVGHTVHTETKTVIDTMKPADGVTVMDSSESMMDDDADIEIVTTDFIDEYLRCVSTLSEEFIDPGFLLKAPLSLATRGSSEPRPTEGTDRTHDHGRLKLTLCTVLRVFKVPEEDSRRRYSLLLQGAAMGPLEVSEMGLGSGSGPSDPNPSLGLIPLLSNKEGQSITSTTATIPPSSASSSTSASSSQLSSPIPTDDALPVAAMRPKARAPSFSYPCDAVEPAPAPTQKPEIRIRKMPICTGSTVPISAISPVLPLRPHTPVVHFAPSPTSGSGSVVGSPTGGAPVVVVTLGQGLESGIHRWVEVSDGPASSRATVPLSVCRFTLITPDRAFSALHRAKYCAATAIAELRSDLLTGSFTFKTNTGLSPAVPGAKNSFDTTDLGSRMSPKSGSGSVKLKVSSVSTDIQSTEEEFDTESEQQKWSETEIALFVEGAKRHKDNVRLIWRSINTQLTKRHNDLYPPPPLPLPPLLSLKVEPGVLAGSTGTTGTTTSGQDHNAGVSQVFFPPSCVSELNTAGNTHTNTHTTGAPSSVPAPPTNPPTGPATSAPTSGPVLKLKTLKDVVAFYYLYSPQHGTAEDNEEAAKVPEPRIPIRQTFISAPIPKRFLLGSGSNPPPANGLSRGLTLGRLRGGPMGRAAAPVPNRWPSTIPYALHRLYWLKSADSPCLCTGLEFPNIKGQKKEAQLTVLMLCCSTYHQEVTLTANALDSFSVEVLHQRPASSMSDLSLSFALAMIDFMEWDLLREANKITQNAKNASSSTSTSTSSSQLCTAEGLRNTIQWYEYPTFIIAMLLHPPSWAAWRKQAERAARGKQSTRRANYFDSMVVDFLARELEKQPERPSSPTPSPSPSLPLSPTSELVVKLDERMSCTYPWDDTPSLEPETVSTHTQAPATSTSSTTSRNGTLPAARAITSSSSSSSSSATVSSAAASSSSSLALTTADSRTATTSEASVLAGPSAPSTVCDLTRSNDMKTDTVLPSYSEGLSSSSESHSRDVPLPPTLTVPVIPQPAQLKNFFSLYWLKRSSLPCGDRFMVQPICCTTYHYPVKVKRGELVSLCEDLVQQCLDDRTVDFTLSLMDFVKWHSTLDPDHALAPRTTGSKTVGEGGGDDEGFDSEGSNTHTAPHTAPHTALHGSSSSSHYQWPEFILYLLKKPVEWASWRKRVERAVLSNRDTGNKSSVKKESVDPQDDKKPGIERSSSDEKDGVKISIDVEGAVVDIGERVVEVPVSERAQGPIKRRTAYFQALCDDLKKSYLEKGNSI